MLYNSSEPGYNLEGRAGGQQLVTILDTDLAKNSPGDRQITHWLYGGDDAYRLKQEIVLGIAGVRMLDALGFETRRFVSIEDCNVSF